MAERRLILNALPRTGGYRRVAEYDNSPDYGSLTELRRDV